MSTGVLLNHGPKTAFGVHSEISPLPGLDGLLLTLDNSGMSSLAQKLNPNRFTEMSPLMAAVVGYVLGESFTDPQIAEMKVSEAENLAYIRKEGDAGFNGVESLEDLRNNWNRLMNVAGLTPEERKEAVELFRAKVGIVPGTQVQ